MILHYAATSDFAPVSQVKLVEETTEKETLYNLFVHVMNGKSTHISNVRGNKDKLEAIANMLIPESIRKELKEVK